MTAAADDLHAKVRLWIARADEDLHAANLLLRSGRAGQHRIAAFHCQQCAEKYLKAFLVLHRVDFPYTHNIARLLELCSGSASWTNGVRDAEELTPYAVTTRYPFEDEPVTVEDAQRALAIAKRLRKVIRTEIDKEGAA